MNKIMPSIIKDVSAQLPKGISSGAPLSPSQQLSVSPRVANAAAHLSWDEKAVGLWLEKIGLKSSVEKFKAESIDGVALEELRRISDDSVAFLSACREYLTFPTFGAILRFSKNLRELS